MSENRVPTPSGRISTELGNPPGRQFGPTQHLIPVAPPATFGGVPVDLLKDMPEPLPRDPRVRVPLPRATPNPPIQVVGFPNLSSPLIGNSGQTGIPWTQFLNSLWRFVQPTGIVPGTYAGIIFNAYGQAISASTSGASFDGATLNNPVLTGNPTAPTPPANDNSQSIATTAWVQEQNYATETYVRDYVGTQGFATEGFVTNALVGYATEAWVLSQGFITEAPVDGHIYGRQNGLWVIVPGSP